MASLFDKLASWNSFKKRHNDDLYDRFSNRYSATFLISASLLTGGRQVIIDRIQCWCPAEVTLHQCSYVKDYCYIANTYYVPDHEHLPGSPSEYKQMVNYYQWVTLVILVQALLFLTPALMWRYYCRRTGAPIELTVQTILETCQNIDSNENRIAIRDLVAVFDRYLQFKHTAIGTGLLARITWWWNPIEIWIVYFVVKIGYLCNALGQIFLINRFLGTNGYNMWGATTISEFLTTGVIPLSPLFPTVTICHVKVRVLGNNHNTYAMQCVLSANIFHDRVYLVIWFWLCLVSAVTMFGIIDWLWMLCRCKAKVRQYLQLRDRCNSEHDEQPLTEFIQDYLAYDGLFLIHMLSKNIPHMEQSLFMAELWDFFLKHRVKQSSLGIVTPPSDEDEQSKNLVRDKSSTYEKGDYSVYL